MHGRTTRTYNLESGCKLASKVKVLTCGRRRTRKKKEPNIWFGQQANRPTNIKWNEGLLSFTIMFRFFLSLFGNLSRGFVFPCEIQSKKTQIVWKSFPWICFQCEIQSKQPFLQYNGERNSWASTNNHASFFPRRCYRFGGMLWGKQLCVLWGSLGDMVLHPKSSLHLSPS